METFREEQLQMDSKRTNGNNVVTSGDVLERIAAINHLAVADVVRLFLLQALPEEEWKLGTLELSPTHETGARPH
jgi:hypothetical protein